jgi:hypothetical protein
VPFEDSARERVDLGEPDGGVAHRLGCEGKSTDAGEQIEVSLFFLISNANSRLLACVVCWASNSEDRFIPSFFITEQRYPALENTPGQ